MLLSCDQIDTNSYDYVVNNSSINGIQRTAKDVKYFEDSFVDRYEYISFCDKKTIVDKFALLNMGEVPHLNFPNLVSFKDTDEMKWWPKENSPSFRSLRKSGGKFGYRELIVNDEVGCSRVWFFKTSN